MKNVSKVSAGKDHAIVLTKQGKILAWGNMEYLSNTRKDFCNNVVDLTEEYGSVSKNDEIVCGTNYTCLYRSKEQKLILFGDT